MIRILLTGSVYRTSATALGLVIASTLAACSSSDEKDAIARGQEAVTTRACATCHTGADSPGSTLAGSIGAFCEDGKPCTTAHVFPANLTPDPDTGMAEWTEDMIVTAIMNGVDDENEPLCPPMPHFQQMGMTDGEAHDIATYLKTLTPVNHAVPESSCPPIKGGTSTGDGGI